MSDWTQLCQSWSSITNQQLNKTHFRQNNVIKIKQQKYTLRLPAQNIKFIVVVFSVHVWDGIVLPLPASRINGGAAISLMYSSVSIAQSLLTEALAQQSPKVKTPHYHERPESIIIKRLFYADISRKTG